MKFETKFSPGDEVWVMHYNKPQKAIVAKVTVSKSRVFSYVPQYEIDCLDSDILNVSEDRLFKTKQELIESL